MIEFKNVSKRYKSEVVLKDLSFTIEDGSFIAIIGPSGCGKTTTLKMINRLIKPTGGTIYLNGKDIMSMDPIKLRRSMGYVIQQTGLFPHMTIKQNLELILKLEKKTSEEISGRIQEVMELIDMDPELYLGAYPNELSGGQQQRIGVARALATNPDIILMDEPFSALDPITRNQLEDELISLHSQLQKTIIFVTHDMDEAIKIATKICIMNEGEIVQFDSPENILRHPKNQFVSDFLGKDRIWASPEIIKAEDIMMTNPVTCRLETSIIKAMEKMRQFKIDSLMVVDRRHKLLGILRAKDIRTADVNLTAKDMMRSEFLSVLPDKSIIDVVEIINADGVSNVPVVTDAGILKGLVTNSSLISTFSEQFIDHSKEERV